MAYQLPSTSVLATDESERSAAPVFIHKRRSWRIGATPPAPSNATPIARFKRVTYQVSVAL
jgi:hypothetical protein